MCGICGQYNFGSRKPVEPETIRRMTESIRHRGPDDEGYFFDGNLGLGFRRLSIIDIEGGHQPMSDREETVWVVFNGEIYNYPELKAELQGRDHVFRTKSDTEVIVHGYKEWGLDVFNHLNGMFGVAIWDVRRKRLILARDAFGIKLVYYRLDDDTLSFGSEIRAIGASGSERADIDPIGLNLFLRYRFTPSPYTIFRDISKLAAGTMLVVEKGKPVVRRWYSYKPEPFSPMPTEAQAAEELLEIYKRAVKRHLLSDVPVGLLLSGGVDSGLLLSLMNLDHKGWPTFTIGYGSSFKDDELRDAEETARILSAKHTSVQIDRTIFERLLPRVVECVEEPIASSSIVPMFLLSERARRDVKVALNGQGPDELFGGYRRHLGVRYGRFWARLPAWIRRPATAAIQALPRNETLKRGASSLAVVDRLPRYQQVLSLAPDDQLDSLFHEGVLPANASDRILDSWADLLPLMKHTDDLGGLQFLELRSTLPDELLMYADKLSMAHSLEVRIPFLDREVVEYVECLDSSLKVCCAQGKRLHRRVCRHFLPKQILQRKKRGFAVNVVDSWLRDTRNGGPHDVLEDKDSLIFRFLRYENVHTLRRHHIEGRHDHHKLLFSLALLEQWMRSSIASQPALII
jgi:asparagine synthase (glutamine-hydrolysing)